MTFSSCGVKARIKKADKKYDIGEYYAAGEMYRSSYKKVSAKDKKTRAYVAFRQGECYRYINNSKAANAYKQAITNRYSDSIVYLHHAQALHYQGKYADAAKSYKIYLEAHPDDYVAQGGLYACQKIAEWRKEPTRYKVAVAKDFNNKRASSFAPMFIGEDTDALMFTSNRTTSAKKNQKNSAITGVPINSLYSIRKNAAGKWEEPEKAEGLYDETATDSQEENETDDNASSAKQEGGIAGADIGVCCFSADGKTMYFTYAKPINGADQGTKIYMSNRASGTWGEPQEVKLFADSTISCGHPALSYSGDTLYFASDAPGGYGGKDLYFAEYINGEWGGITNLGFIINTAGDELYPTLRKDGTLYFSSNGHPGYGGLDIYKAIPQDTTWLLYNMGTPFNSTGDDFGITFAGDTENGFFSSNRSQKKGYDMIYSFLLPEMVFMVEGTVTDNNGEFLTDATLRLVGDDGTNAKVQVRRDGTYRLKLRKDARYVMLATARGYLNQKQTVSTLNLTDSKTYTQDFSLTPISKPVTMNNIFYEFAKWDLTPASEDGLNALVKLLQDNPNITIELSAHTDKVGNAESNRLLSEKRAQSVVNYLIARGIDKDRLTPVGYGKEKPVVADKALHQQYKFIPVEQELNAEFIEMLTPEQQDICNQINRRTEFKVLTTTYKLY
ncbi:MAG: OmpA family protein [Paludibacter sp.]|nr:OmpA family protein [Bacteroidales bacterium]MCM1069890.1 OmpA family protein [Prevotella sp.]MCM1354571.1 OmpA family protein [Bacteroides sp.]MCM1443466.1 OmpA family protein [Muribaculum sp.]MCM1482550.1 OmpA family protein [Paludibacter sp.]